MDNQKRVREWNEKAGNECPDKPTMPPLAVREKQIRMLLEEVFEFAEDGCGLYVHFDGWPVAKDDLKNGLWFSGTPEGPSIKEAADALADIEVVNLGAAASFGIPLQKCFDAVMDNNDTKFRWRLDHLTEAESNGCTVKKLIEKSFSLDNGMQVFSAVVKDPSGKIMKPPTMTKVDLGKVIGV